jgi:quinol monooxygenase YgiN
MVICAYRPKPGREQALEAVIAKHVDVLRAQGLATNRPAHVMRAQDGTIVEVFEWASAAAIDRAHSNPVVLALWEEFGAVCDFVPVGDLGEARKMFSEFEAVDRP